MTAAETKWGARAAATYDRRYAEAYRARDEAADGHDAIAGLGRWLGGVCDRFGGSIDVLDLGCGTGRYFQFVRGARRLVGVDVSTPMLDVARRPIGAVTVDAVTLVEADFLAPDFQPGEFDLVYSIGVLAEHSPLNEQVVTRVWRWLKPGGRFAFSTVHPDSPSVPATARRTLGRLLLPATAGPVRRWLRGRLMSGGLYADEAHIHDLLSRMFTIESLTRMTSEAHLHCLCVARKGAQ